MLSSYPSAAGPLFSGWAEAAATPSRELFPFGGNRSIVRRRVEQQRTFAENRADALQLLIAARKVLARECELTEHEAAALRSSVTYIGWAQGELGP